MSREHVAAARVCGAAKIIPVPVTVSNYRLICNTRSAPLLALQCAANGGRPLRRAIQEDQSTQALLLGLTGSFWVRHPEDLGRVAV
jgi:hypothetical protein